MPHRQGSMPHRHGSQTHRSIQESDAPPALDRRRIVPFRSPMPHRPDLSRLALDLNRNCFANEGLSIRQEPPGYEFRPQLFDAFVQNCLVLIKPLNVTIIRAPAHPLRLRRKRPFVRIMFTY